MSEKSRLTEEELEFILGDEPVKVEAQNSSGFEVFKSTIESSVSQIAQSYASKIGEEMAITVASVEQGMEPSIEEPSPPYYIASGTFTNNGNVASYLVYPLKTSQELVQKSTGVENIGESEDQISEPLKEIAEGHLVALAEHIKEGFVGIIDSVTKQEDLSTLKNDSGIVKVHYTIGTEHIYHFFDTAILNFFENESAKITQDRKKEPEFLQELPSKPDTLEESLLGLSGDTSAQTPPAASDDFSSFFNSAETKSAPSSSTDADDPFASLSESLGKPAGQAARVEFADLGGQPSSKEKSPIDFLMDVSMEVAVELGRTKKRVNEILELGRGAIIELNKLAGEPLDIMVNQKLIAKGEVVVIDEHFGIRVVEIISQNEREHSVS